MMTATTTNARYTDAVQYKELNMQIKSQHNVALLR